jgi:hypothetical protein
VPEVLLELAGIRGWMPAQQSCAFYPFEVITTVSVLNNDQMRGLGMKTVSRLLLAAVLAVGALAASIAPASAQGSPCTDPYGTSQVYACESVLNGSASANIRSNNGRAFYDFTLAIEECRTDMTYCKQFSAISDMSGEWYSSYPLDIQPCAFGHVYRVHASWYDAFGYPGEHYVDARSVWTTC